MNALAVFVGGGIGSVLRYVVGLAVGVSAFPLATFAVNVVGSLAIGIFGGLSVRFGWYEPLRLALVTGLCGGFTTFSTFSKESLALAETGRWCAFAAYVIESVAVGVAAVALGYWVARH